MGGHDMDESGMSQAASRQGSQMRDQDKATRTRKRKRKTPPRTTASLPYNANLLSKEDFSRMRDVFASYLDIQKQLSLNDLTNDESKGRWKSFVKKWNRGELAQGWYDPASRARASTMLGWSEQESPTRMKALQHRERDRLPEDRASNQNDEEDEYGPSLPSSGVQRQLQPANPTRDDLALRDEALAEEAESHVDALRTARKLHRSEQRSQLDEIAPRAQAGTRERQLEKRREFAASNRTFADAKDSGAVEVADADLMGDGGIETYKARKAAEERKKSEREIRREELWRARAAEREERLAAHKIKEDKTMEMLKALAKERFG